MEPVHVIYLIVALFVVVILATRAIKIIRQAETMIIERLGRYHRTLGSGINFILPFVDRPRKAYWRYVRTDHKGNVFVTTKTTPRIDLRETIYDYPRQRVITKDNVGIEINALLYFQVTDPLKALYQIANLPDAIKKLTITTLRNVIGALDLDETLVSRDTVNNKLRIILDEATDRWGVKVNRVELQDINPPKDLQAAMEKQMRAERDRRATILQAEGEKKSAILQAEGVREGEINRAEGYKRSAILKAEGDAEARVKVAQAEAEAILKITESISRTQGDPANYLIAVRYIEALKEMVSGKDNKVVYLPYEATGILSSIGGIKEMLAGIKK
jgi:regulator of protease activity HflC (stomatin/prohibitin superfamily)